MNKLFNHYYYQLPSRYQKVYNIILSAWKNKLTNVNVPAYLIDLNDTNKIIEAIALDHPEVFWCNYYNYRMKITPTTITFTFDLFFTLSEIKQLEVKMEKWRIDIVKQIPRHFSQTDKYWLLYDYLARQVSYKECGEAYSHTIIGIINSGHYAVCEGVSKSFKYLCDGINLPCIIVIGQLYNGLAIETHAWNLVSILDSCKHIDVTSEIIHAHLSGKAKRDSFLLRDDQMKMYQWDKNMIIHCT